MDVVDVALLVTRALERCGVAYFLGGSLASSFQGEPRATNDIDLVVDLTEPDVGPFVAALGPDFDVGPFDASELARRRRVEVRAGQSLLVKSAEDTVLRKLLWYRAGGSASDRQWRDVVQVLRQSRDLLDRSYLDTWAGALDLVDLLARASEEAGR